MRNLFLLTISLFIFNTSFAQLNGQLDDVSEFSTKITVPFEMPDGIKLMTDVYLPIFKDSLVVDLSIPPFDDITLELIPKNIQVIMYDSILTDTGMAVNDNPFQLPVIFTRTPYNKNGLSLIHI